MDTENNENIENETVSTETIPVEPVDINPEAVVERPIQQSQKTRKNPRKVLIILISLLVVLVTVAAVWFISTNTAVSPEIKPVKITENGQKYIVNANNKFAFDLYSQLDNDENVFFSPYSISSAMAVVYEGARGGTASEIKSALYFPDNEALRSNFIAAYENINKKNNNYELSTVNDLWIDKTLPIKQDYLDVIMNHYKAKASNVDFVNNKEKARKTINDYISRQTKKRIPELLKSGNIDVMTKLIITNAIYFKGDWEEPFEEDNTKNRSIFHKTDTQNIEVDLMYKYDSEDLNYTEDKDVQILELPYKGDDLSMLIVLPKKDLNSIKPILTKERLDKYRLNMEAKKIGTIALPKFELDTKYELAKDLDSLGIKKAFNASTADFSGIATNSNGKNLLSISEVIHQAYVKVDEEGTEAAAATVVVMKTAAPAEKETKKINFIANKPFMFIIQENNSGNILFMGKINNPSPPK